MRLDNRIVLIAIAAFTLGLIPVALYTSGPLRIILSFLCLIFFPGFTLMSALFPKPGDIGAIERIALSFGASMAIVPITGFVLNFTPWGIKPIPILISVGVLIMVMSVIGFIRQQLLPRELRFAVKLKFEWPGWSDMTRVKKGLIMAGILAAIMVISLALYFATALPLKQIPTEFYILNAEGEAGNYLRQVKVNDNINLTAVIINHENQNTGYTIQITDNGTRMETIDTGILSPAEKWERPVKVTLKSIGNDQRVEFFLFKDGEEAPYFTEPLYLYIDTTE